MNMYSYDNNIIIHKVEFVKRFSRKNEKSRGAIFAPRLNKIDLVLLFLLRRIDNFVDIAVILGLDYQQKYYADKGRARDT